MAFPNNPKMDFIFIIMRSIFDSMNPSLSFSAISEIYREIYMNSIHHFVCLQKQRHEPVKHSHYFANGFFIETPLS